jgi:hypothetical protein
MGNKKNKHNNASTKETLMSALRDGCKKKRGKVKCYTLVVAYST